MTSNVELLPLPDGWNARILNEWGRACVEANAVALRAEVEQAKGRAAANLQRAADAEAQAERLAEALRVIEGFTMSQFPDAADMAGACVETAHNALHPTAAQEDGRE